MPDLLHCLHCHGTPFGPLQLLVLRYILSGMYKLKNTLLPEVQVRALIRPCPGAVYTHLQAKNAHCIRTPPLNRHG